MRKRLRKKLQKGEFAVPVIPIAFRMGELADPDRNNLLDRFVAEAIEANGLQFGGGGGGSVWSGFAEPVNWPGSISDDQRSAVETWIASQPEIVERFVGEITTDSETLMDQDPDFPRSRLGASDK
ncbi:MAG: 50S ribosome-binding protein YggL [Phycisphaerae bacterium]|jgi:hypothetical protein|nr:50S ribosome-binding protein YggL [Phycisphaerae bacterium]